MSTLQEECRTSVERLRASLADLYASVGADPETPQDVSRAFNLNASLTWNISKLIKAADELAAVPYIPGAKSLERVLVAAKAHGAPDHAIQNVRDAITEFEHMIEIHIGDRPTLDLIIDGLVSGNDDALVNARKRSFHGDSGIYGIQAKSKMACFLIAPNPENPHFLDVVEIRGYFEIRRLRADVRMPLFVQRTWRDIGQDTGIPAWQTLEPDAKDPILPDYQKACDPEFEIAHVDRGFEIFARPGAIGNSGKFDCVFADKLIGGVSRYKVGEDETGEVGDASMIPTEQLIIDILAHRDVVYALHTKQVMYARIGFSTEMVPLPIHCRPYILAGSSPAVATPHVPRYPSLMNKVFSLLGWDPTDFHGSRLEMKYPPLGAMINRRFDLPTIPS